MKEFWAIQFTSGRQSVVAVATGNDVKTIVKLRRK
jgi:hypothetical protein